MERDDATAKDIRKGGFISYESEQHVLRQIKINSTIGKKKKKKKKRPILDL
jgi:hypothetical protein